MLKFGSSEGNALVGHMIMYNWGTVADPDDAEDDGEVVGWVRGQIIERNTDGALTVDGDTVNFIVEYADDPRCQHVLTAADYSNAEDAEEDSWFIILVRLRPPYLHSPCATRPASPRCPNYCVHVQASERCMICSKTTQLQVCTFPGCEKKYHKDCFEMDASRGKDMGFCTDHAHMGATD